MSDYSASLIELLLEHYHDTHGLVDAEYYADLDRALVWLKYKQPVLHSLVMEWAKGVPEVELAALCHVSESTVRAYIRYTCTQLATFLNMS